MKSDRDHGRLVLLWGSSLPFNFLAPFWVNNGSFNNFALWMELMCSVFTLYNCNIDNVRICTGKKPLSVNIRIVKIRLYDYLQTTSIQWLWTQRKREVSSCPLICWSKPLVRLKNMTYSTYNLIVERRYKYVQYQKRTKRPLYCANSSNPFNPLIN